MMNAGFSTDSYLKYGVGTLLTSIAILSAFILAPEDHSRKETLATTREFGEFIANNHQMIDSEKRFESSPVSPSHTQVQQKSAAHELNEEQATHLKQLFADWGQKEFVRDEKWRSEVESLFDLAEKSGSSTVLDYLKPQIIFARYDKDSKNQVYAQVWIERYLKLETREFQRGQIQDLILR